MRILVTGSSGRIGSMICGSFDASYDVYGVDLNPGRYTTHEQNILCPELDHLIGDVDAVIHCAALHAPHLAEHSNQEFWNANVETTRKLLSLSNDNVPFVLTSSTSVFGSALEASNEVVWVDETLQEKPRDIYDESKLEAEALLERACVNGRVGTALRVARCFSESDMLMALYRCHRGVDLRDVVQAHHLALARKVGFAKYVISGPTPFKQSDAIELVDSPWQCLAAYYPELNPIFDKLGWEHCFSPDRVYSSELAQSEIAYRPRYGILEFLSGDRNPQPLV